MVKIDAFQALDQGSIPCYGNIIIKCSLQHIDIDIKRTLKKTPGSSVGRAEDCSGYNIP